MGPSDCLLMGFGFSSNSFNQINHGDVSLISRNLEISTGKTGSCCSPVSTTPATKAKPQIGNLLCSEWMLSAPEIEQTHACYYTNLSSTGL